MSSPTAPTFRLTRQAGRVLFHPGSDGTEQPARLVWACPVSRQPGAFAILDEKKKELAFVTDLADLDPASRHIATEELRQRYLMPKIQRVIRTRSQLGTRYWEVATDHGPQHFVIRNPNRDVVWFGDDRLVLRDTLGNRYEIESLAALDSRSREEIDRVI